MDYYIEEDKTFNTISGITNAKIELTFSDGTKIMYYIPTDGGTLTIKGSDIIEETGALFKKQIRVYEKAILNLPFVYNEKGNIYTMEKIWLWMKIQLK